MTSKTTNQSHDDDTIIIYSSPSCMQCIAACKILTSTGKKFEKIDITKDEEGRKVVQDLGYKQLPVIVKGDIHFSGFNIDKIKSL